MERSFECPICLEQFSPECKPLLIPCGHTACEGCISALQKDRATECPVCRSLHHNLNVSALSVNYALMVSEQKTTSKQSLWSKIEEIHKQSTTLEDLQQKLQFNYEESILSTAKVRSEIQQNYEMITGLIANTHKLLFAHLEEIDRDSDNKMDRVKNQMKAVQAQRIELLNSLQSCYTNNQDLGPSVKLQLLSTDLPDFSIDFASYTLAASSLKSPDQARTWLGSIEKVPTTNQEIVVGKSKSGELVQELRGSEVVEDLRLSQRSEKKEERKEEGGRGRPGRGRGRGENREEWLKQPRQARDEINWFVENRFGNWEKLPSWFDTQLKAATEKGDKVVKVFDKGKPVYLVKFEELKSYVLLKNDKIGRSNRIRYDAD